MCSPGVLGLAVGALVEAARVYGNYLYKRIPANTQTHFKIKK
jgi:hypothetical protein